MKRYTHSPLPFRMIALLCLLCFHSSGLVAKELEEESSINVGISTLIELDKAFDFFDSKKSQNENSSSRDAATAVLVESMEPTGSDFRSLGTDIESKSSLTLELEKIVERNAVQKVPVLSNSPIQTPIESDEMFSELASPDAAGTGNMAQVVESLIPLSSLGKLPLPIAKVTTKEGSSPSLSQLKNRSVGELGGSPYGPDFGKATFGAGEDNNSFKGITNGNKSDETQGKDTPPEVEPKKPELAEQIETLRQDMGKLAQKLEPFNENNYNTYEKAKSLFTGNENILKGMENVDPAFLDNAKELFIDQSWRDRDSTGKKAFENFLERFEPKTRFPYPKGKEPRPKIHREGEIHLDNGRK